jgi:hypothetical protein
MWFVGKSRRRDFVPAHARMGAGSNLREMEALLLGMIEIPPVSGRNERFFAAVRIRNLSLARLLEI